MPRPPSLPRAAARPTRPTIPRAPRPRIRPTARAQPCAHCTSIAYALLPSSASLCVATEQIQNRRLGRCHREVPPASRPPHAAIRIPLCRHRADPALIAPPSRPPRADIRVTPPSLSSRCGGPRALAGKNRAVCIPFSPNARKRPLSWQHLPEMHAFRDQDGNILALCIPFPGAIGRFRIHGARILPPRAFFRVEEPEITHGAKMLPAPPGLSAAAACGMAERALRHATAACDTRHGRTGFAPCGAGLACLPPAPLPAISLVPAAACAPAISPAFIAVVLHASRFATRIAPTVRRHSPHRPLRSGRAVDQALPAALVLPTPTHRVHRCALAGTARAPTRANRTPALSQPSPAHPWSRLRPSAPRHPLHLALPRGSRCGSGNSCEMVR